MSIEITRNDDLQAEQVRHAVLALPSIMQAYFPDRTSPVENAKLENAVLDITRGLEASGEAACWQWAVGWSDREAQAFFSNEEVQPYRSKIDLSKDPLARREQFVAIGRFLHSQLREKEAQAQPVLGTEQESLKASAATTRSLLKRYVVAAMGDLFNPVSFDLQDRFNGIDPQERKSGKIELVKELRLLIEEETGKVAQDEHVDCKELHRDVLLATEDGNFQTIRMFLENKRGSAPLRKALERIYVRRANDERFGKEKVQLLWDQLVFLEDMGIDVETYFRINNYPNRETTAASILEFLRNEEYVAEVLAHLQSEAPQIAEAYAKTGEPISYLAMLFEKANKKGLSDGVSTADELNISMKSARDAVVAKFPKDENLTNTPIHAPTGLGALARPMSFTYENREGIQVELVLMNPRMGESQEEVIAHELAHAWHALTVFYAEQVGFVMPKSCAGVTAATKEKVARCIQNGVGALLHPVKESMQQKRASLPKAEHQWSNLADAILIRAQGPYALLQLEVWYALEEQWKLGGKGDLSDGDLTRLHDNFQIKLGEWIQEGVDFVNPSQTFMTRFDTIIPFDGLMYLTSLFSGQSSLGDAQQSFHDNSRTLEEIFKDTFGDQWAGNPLAWGILKEVIIEHAKKPSQNIEGLASAMLSAKSSRSSDDNSIDIAAS